MNKRNIHGIIECAWWEIATSQRKREISEGKGTRGTMNFENKGCYTCNGYETTCPYYESGEQPDLFSTLHIERDDEPVDDNGMHGGQRK